MSTRVAHVIGALAYGGVESIALDLLCRLPPDEVKSSVYFTGEVITGRRKDFEDAAARFVHCPFHSHRRIEFIRRLSAAFREDRIEAVLSYSFGNHAWISMAARLAGVRRCYVTVQGSPARDRLALKKNSLLAHLARPFCTGEIAASKQVGKELTQGLRLPRRRVHVIENACDVAEIAMRASRARSRREMNNPPVVLMIARMDDAKDHETIIRACALLNRSGRPVRLRLAGDGPNRARHEALCKNEGVEDVVEFLGNRTDIPELLGTSDIAVLATHTEGLPVVLTEAMSAGTPVIATDIPVCREVLDSGRCGLLVPPHDPNALAAAIHRLLEDDILRNQLASEGYARAADFYDINILVSKYMKLLVSSPRHSLNILS